MNEAEQIRLRFGRRRPRAEIFGDRLIIEERAQRFAELLASNRVDPRTARVLDVGCGNGKFLNSLVAMGFEPKHLTGIDLIPGRIQETQRLLPLGTTVVCNDFLEEPFAPGSFDLVILFTVLSSILDEATRFAVAAKALRILSPRGAVVLYDMRVPSPANRDVTRISWAQVRTLFPGAAIEKVSLTLLPPIARALRRRHSQLYSWLAKAPMLRTHQLCWISRSPAEASDEASRQKERSSSVRAASLS